MSTYSNQAFGAARQLVLCAGLPLVGTRPLELRELTAIRQDFFRYAIWALLWLAAIPLCLLAPLAVWLFIVLLLGESESVLDMISTTTAFLLVLGIPFAILKARDMFKRARLLKRTASAGVVWCFEGALDVYDWTNPALKKLARHGLVGPDLRGAARIEVLADSEVIYRVNDVYPRRWTVVRLTRAAAPPVAPARFRAPDEWQAQDNDREVERRRLNPAESDELLGYAKRLRRRSMVLAPIAFWIVANLLWALTSRLMAIPRQLGFIVTLSITIGVSAWLYYRTTRAAKRLEYDAQHGWATILEPPPVQQEPSQPVPDLSVEVLPISGTLWTVNGKPAGWRRSKNAN